MGTYMYLYMNIEPSALMYDLYIKVCKCFTMLNVTLSPGGTTTNPYSAAHLQPNPSFPLSRRPPLPSGPPLHLHKPPPGPRGTPGPTPKTLTNWRGHKSEQLGFVVAHCRGASGFVTSRKRISQTPTWDPTTETESSRIVNHLSRIVPPRKHTVKPHQIPQTEMEN